MSNLAIKAQDLDLSGDLDVTDDVAVGGDIAVTGTTSVAGIKQGAVVVTNAATYAVLAANSGKTHIIPDLTADTVITLPTAAADLYYKFIYGGVAADAQDWIIKTGSNTNFYKGGVLHLDTNAGAGTDELVPVYPNGTTNSMIDFDTPDAGTEIEVWCDGTNWYIHGQCAGVTAPTFADNA